MSWVTLRELNPLALPLALICWWSGVLSESRASAQSVVAWGYDSSGQTNVPPGLGTAVSVAGGYSHSLALLADGTVAAWGSSAGTNVPAGLSNVVAVAAGNSFSLALRTDGTVVAWGDNTYGRATPPAGLSNVVAIAAGKGHGLALRADGSVVPWGYAGAYQGLSATVGNLVAVAAGWWHSVGLRADGTVVAWGDNSYGQCNVPAGLSNVVAIAAGGNYTLALKADGTMSAWTVGSWFWPPGGLSNVVAIAAGANHTLALKADGMLTAWGSNNYGQTNVPAGISGVVALSAGDNHSLAVVGSGPPVLATALANRLGLFSRPAEFYALASGAWPLSYQWQFNGADLPGATTPMLTVTNVQFGALGNYTVTVSNSLGQLTSSNMTLALVPAVSWGGNSIANPTNQAGCPPNINAISAAPYGALALRPDGRVYGWGMTGSGYAIPPGLSNVTAVVAGQNYDVALNADGTVKVWGNSAYTNVPASFTNAVAIAGGYDHILALRSDGTIVTSPATPLPFGLTNVVAVAAGGNGNNLVLKADGTVVAWGGTFGVPSGLSNIVAVSEGYDHALGLQPDGTVVAWGANTYGQSSVPAGLTNVIALSAGYYTSLALQADGTAVSWGYQAANPPAGLSNVVAVAEGKGYSLGLVGNGPPFLLAALANRMTFVGGAVTFYATASGAWPLSYQWQCNGTNLPGATSPVLVLTNVQVGAAGAYTLTVTNSQGTATSSPALLSVVDFGPALNTTNLNWQSYGDVLWFAETNVTHDGVAAMQSGSLSGDGSTAPSSTLETAVTGPGTLTFWWKIAVSGYQYCSLYINGTDVGYITGQTDWQLQTFYLGAGPQVLDWRFSSWSPYIGSNTAWVDEVSFTPGTTAPMLTGQPLSQSQGRGADATFSVSATGTPPFNYQWQFNGSNIAGATGSAFTVTNVQAASAGSYSVMVSNVAGSVLTSNAVLVPGQIAVWGNLMPLPPTLTNAVALGAGESHGLALEPDGTVVGWGYDNNGQTDVPPGLSNVVAVAGGGWFSLALTAEGNVIAWGDNSSGQTQVPAGLSNVVAVAGGLHHALALQSNGIVVAWGDNAYGATNVPTQVTNVVAIAAGFADSLALKADGTVVAWGNNTSGQTNVPAGLTNVVALAAGLDHFLALTATGNLVVWGDSAYGLTNVPAGSTDVAAISAGGYHNLMLQANGRVVAWGWNQAGDTGVPAALNNVVTIAAGAVGSLALAGDAPAPLFVPVQAPTLSNGGFSVSVPTRTGRVYQLQFVESLTSTSWTGLRLIVGTGRPQLFTDPTPSSAQRFYRVRQW